MSVISHMPPMTPTSPACRRISLIGYDGVQSLDLVGPLEVFSMANRFGAPIPYEVILASPEGGEIVANSGLRLAGSRPVRFRFEIQLGKPPQRHIIGIRSLPRIGLGLR